MSNITKDSIESAYCFFHQKLRVYEFSTNPTQRDDIEYAISQYVAGMSSVLYARLSGENGSFLLSHPTFEQDMRAALSLLEEMMK